MVDREVKVRGWRLGLGIREVGLGEVEVGEVGLGEVGLG